MDAVVLEEWDGDLSVESVTVLDPGPGEVRVDVRACGITRTVENAIRGGLSDDPDLTARVPGHESAGVVEAVYDGPVSLGEVPAVHERVREGRTAGLTALEL